MKLTRFAWVLLVFALLLTTVGWNSDMSLAAPSETASVNETEGIPTYAYIDILDRLYHLMSTDFADAEIEDGEVGVSEIVNIAPDGESLNQVGFRIDDISGDGIPELLIGTVKDKDDIYYVSEVLAVYTLVDDVPTLAFEGWGRSSYKYAVDGQFVYHGSAGAMYTIFGVYELSTDGTTLEAKDYYFTHERDDDPSEIGFFYNQTGEWDKSLSEPLMLEPEQFWKIELRFGKLVRPYELTPFAMYESSGNDATKADVQVHSDAETIANLPDFDDFVADSNEGQMTIAFTTDVGLSEFSVLQLSIEDVDAEGNMTFQREVIYTQDNLTPERPLVVYLTFSGTIPDYGISFVDKDGQQRYYYLAMSGLDGSIELVEFEE